MPENNRLSHLFEYLQQSGLDGLVLNPGPSLVYLAGQHFHLSERPVLAVFLPGQPVTMILPEFEAPRAAAAPLAPRVFSYGENPSGWQAVFTQALHTLGLKGKKIGVEPLRMRLLEYSLLEGAGTGAAFQSAQDVLARLRMHKDAAELESMRRAVGIAQTALRAALASIHPGVTELDVAAELTLQLLRSGSDAELPFMPIVAGGPNSADPHSVPTARPLTPGDLLVIDWGAAYGGYFADLTRTFGIGKVDPELAKIHSVVQAANRAGVQASRPGATAGDVDRGARGVIEQAGYGPYFTHRTGHGLGMETHEDPYMIAGSPLILEPGMTYTVEPGIYLTGRGGVRVEDNVAISASGVEVLSDFPRELICLE